VGREHSGSTRVSGPLVKAGSELDAAGSRASATGSQDGAARRLPVAVSPSYDVVIGQGLLAAAADFVAERHVAIVSDEHVAPLYAGSLSDSLRGAGKQVMLLTVSPGEASKQVGVWSQLLEAMATSGLNRDAAVVALGGGVVGDLGGFAAATYLRGVALYQFPTSLLAMVDSSVGGKTGLDLPQGKNLVGAFWQPRAVVADIDTLATLPAAEFRQGTVELVKTGFLGDPWLVDLVEGEWSPTVSPALLSEAVARSVAVKAAKVAADERESGVRAHLNLGHTLGHAIEAASDLQLPHGDCVLYGMLYAALLAEGRGLSDLVARFAQLIERLQPRPLPELDYDRVTAYMGRDKKAAQGRLKFVLLHDVGVPVVVGDVSDAERALAWRRLKEMMA